VAVADAVDGPSDTIEISWKGLRFGIWRIEIRIFGLGY